MCMALAALFAIVMAAGMAYKMYPIHGDCRSPAQEAKRYSDLVSSTVPLRRGFPTFDIVLLGAGEKTVFQISLQYIIIDIHSFLLLHNNKACRLQAHKNIQLSLLI